MEGEKSPDLGFTALTSSNRMIKMTTASHIHANIFKMSFGSALTMEILNIECRVMAATIDMAMAKNFEITPR